MDIGRLSLTGIQGVQAMLHLSGIITLKDVNRYTQRLGIPYLLWLAPVVTSCGKENISLPEISDDFQLPSPFPGNLFQSRSVSAEQVEPQRFFRLLLFLAFFALPYDRGCYRFPFYLTIFIHRAHFGVGGSPVQESINSLGHVRMYGYLVIIYDFHHHIKGGRSLTLQDRFLRV